ncbi:MAG: phospholipase D-like domain-containing protein [Nanoarchaeota archaeon]
MKKLLLFTLLALLVTACTPEATIPEEQGYIEVFFCPKDNCEQAMIDIISQAQTVKCAFYDLDLENLTAVLKAKNAELLIDEDNYDNYGQEISGTGLMHDKFCVLNERVVITGSMNPTYRGAYKNNNNLIIIESPTLAQNYLAEFEEIKHGRENKKTKYTEIKHNNRTIQNFFCPDDACEEKVLRVLNTANSSIYFMTFSFTSDAIGDLLIEKRNNIEIRGIFEKSQNSKWSEKKKMDVFNMETKVDSNPANLHHKVFIIDEKIVILGSYNPTNNGNTRNDENILIIHDKSIAAEFMEEFKSLYGGEADV